MTGRARFPEIFISTLLVFLLFSLVGHLQQFKTLEEEEGRRAELAEVDRLLRQDLRNNSVWNHRWFVLHSTLGAEPLSDEVRDGMRGIHGTVNIK